MLRHSVEKLKLRSLSLNSQTELFQPQNTRTTHLTKQDVCEAGSAPPHGAAKIIPILGGVRVGQYLVFSVVLSTVVCLLLFLF